MDDFFIAAKIIGILIFIVAILIVSFSGECSADEIEQMGEQFESQDTTGSGDDD